MRRQIMCPLTGIRRISPLCRRMRRQEGNALVEMTLVSMMLCSILFGIFELCMATYTYHCISELACEGARYAMVRGSDCTNLDNCSATSAQLQSYIQGVGFLGKNNLSASATWYSPSATTPTTWTLCASQCNSPGDAVQVKVTFAYPLLLPFLPQSTLNMSSTAFMVITN